MANQLEISSGDIYRLIFNGITEEEELALVLYAQAQSQNTVEVIPFDGAKVVGRLGGGASVNELGEFVRRMEEKEFCAVLTAGGVGLASHAEEYYRRPPKIFTLSG